MANRRVVVTGIGLVSSLGIGTEVNWAALTAGTSGVGTITRFDATQFATRIAGEVRGFDPLRFIEKKDVKKMDVFIQYALAASQMAMDDARLAVGPELSDRVGVFIASGDPYDSYSRVEVRGGGRADYRCSSEGDMCRPQYCSDLIVNIFLSCEPVGGTCGDGVCDYDETSSCSADCGWQVPW